MRWILDFDDTLVLGPNTWAFEVVLPEFIEKYQLQYEKARFETVMLEAQKRGSEDANEAELLNYVFDALGWRSELKAELVERVFYGYVPSLFPDTIPFLQRLHAFSQNLYIVSNNNRAEGIAQTLGIADYFDAIYTPRYCGEARPKPHLDMWSFLGRDQGLQPRDAVSIIGDDPWADGQFAQRCGLPCWIIDRLERYISLREQMPFGWLTSLTELEVHKGTVHRNL